MFQCLDWEVELVIVIGKEGKNIKVRQNALLSQYLPRSSHLVHAIAFHPGITFIEHKEYIVMKVLVT